MLFRSRYRNFPLSKYVATSTLMAWLCAVATIALSHLYAPWVSTALHGPVSRSIPLIATSMRCLTGLGELVEGKIRLAEG